MGRPAKIADGIGARLAQIRDGMERKEFAEKVGVVEGTLGNYERGERTPDLKFFALIKGHQQNINLNWLITGQGEMYERSNHVSASEEFIKLPQFDVNASAGRGEIAYQEHAVNEVSFERRFLRDLGAQPDACFIMWGKGDSMLPTFPDGAMLIVDQSQQVVDDGRIYVFNVGGNLLVKRARWRFDFRLELVSDNAAAGYPVESFDTDRIQDLVVVGRVIWYGRAI